jgi:hypothetical protein
MRKDVSSSNKKKERIDVSSSKKRKKRCVVLYHAMPRLAGRVRNVCVWTKTITNKATSNLEMET